MTVGLAYSRFRVKRQHPDSHPPHTGGMGIILIPIPPTSIPISSVGGMGIILKKFMVFLLEEIPEYKSSSFHHSHHHDSSIPSLSAKTLIKNELCDVYLH